MTEKKYARVVDGVVIETVNLPANWDLNVVYHPDIAKELVACTAKAEPGWTYDGKFAAPKLPEVTKDDLIAHAANKRWQVEVGGMTLNGIAVATDDRSKIMIMGARLKAESDPTYVETWKTRDGTHVELQAAQLIAISNAVLSFVSNCFSVEAEVVWPAP